MTSRKKPGVAFWATVAMSLILLYVLSIRPAYRLLRFHGDPPWAWAIYRVVYAPLLLLPDDGQPWKAIEWWCYLDF
jgi:hypothetical protein